MTVPVPVPPESIVAVPPTWVAIAVPPPPTCRSPAARMMVPLVLPPLNTTCEPSEIVSPPAKPKTSCWPSISSPSPVPLNVTSSRPPLSIRVPLPVPPLDTVCWPPLSTVVLTASPKTVTTAPDVASVPIAVAPESMISWPLIVAETDDPPASSKAALLETTVPSAVPPLETICSPNPATVAPLAMPKTVCWPSLIVAPMSVPPAETVSEPPVWTCAVLAVPPLPTKRVPPLLTPVALTAPNAVRTPPLSTTAAVSVPPALTVSLPALVTTTLPARPPELTTIRLPLCVAPPSKSPPLPTSRVMPLTRVKSLSAPKMRKVAPALNSKSKSVPPDSMIRSPPLSTRAPAGPSGMPDTTPPKLICMTPPLAISAPKSVPPDWTISVPPDRTVRLVMPPFCTISTPSDTVPSVNTPPEATAPVPPSEIVALLTSPASFSTPPLAISAPKSLPPDRTISEPPDKTEPLAVPPPSTSSRPPLSTTTPKEVNPPDTSAVLPLVTVGMAPSPTPRRGLTGRRRSQNGYGQCRRFAFGAFACSERQFSHLPQGATAHNLHAPQADRKSRVRGVRTQPRPSSERNPAFTGKRARLPEFSLKTGRCSRHSPCRKKGVVWEVMAVVELESLTKRYGAVAAVDDLTRDDRAWLAGLPAGAVGLRQDDDVAAGRRVSSTPTAARSGSAAASSREPGRSLPPERRNMSMIFQSYALWPHMTIAENVAYGLRVAQARARRARAPGRGDPRRRASRRAGAALSARIVGRPAAARRAGPRAGRRAGDPAARRAARRTSTPICARRCASRSAACTTPTNTRRSM